MAGQCRCENDKAADVEKAECTRTVCAFRALQFEAVANAVSIRLRWSEY